MPMSVSWYCSSSSKRIAISFDLYGLSVDRDRHRGGTASPFDHHTLGYIGNRLDPSKQTQFVRRGS